MGRQPHSIVNNNLHTNPNFPAANLIRDEGITGTGGVPSIVYDLFESSAVGAS